MLEPVPIRSLDIDWSDSALRLSETVVVRQRTSDNTFVFAHIDYFQNDYEVVVTELITNDTVQKYLSYSTILERYSVLPPNNAWFRSSSGYRFFMCDTTRSYRYGIHTPCVTRFALEYARARVIPVATSTKGILQDCQQLYNQLLFQERVYDRYTPEKAGVYILSDNLLACNYKEKVSVFHGNRFVDSSPLNELSSRCKTILIDN